eukprot:PhM_4_TR9471/c2_g1_i2/m.2196/K17609/NXN; nucleoredoxin
MSRFSFATLLKTNKLINKSLETVDVASAIDGKTVMLYLSASWCPPCRAFTPKLAAYYEALKSKHNDKVEIVFVSLDNEQQAFTDYYGKMPWLAIPFNPETKDDANSHLMSEFGLSTIPSLVILNPDGSVVTTAGRNVVLGDAQAEQFPYTAESADTLARAGAAASSMM